MAFPSLSRHFIVAINNWGDAANWHFDSTHLEFQANENFR